MPHLAIHLFGTPRLERDGAPVGIQRRKVMALLAYLAVTGRSHHRDWLATMFWPAHDQVAARAALRRTLSELQKILGGKEILRVEHSTLGLHPGADFWLDIHEFHSRLEAYRLHGHHPGDPCPDCLVALAQAVLLYQDDFLAGFTLSDCSEFDEWQLLETEVLRRGLIDALSRLVLGHAANGELAPAIEFARHWLALDPVDETAHRHLMQLYAWNGQRSDALRQYQECVRLIQRELGIPPLEETTALYQHILSQKEFTSPAITITQPGSRQRKPNNLPVPLTSFVGREMEMKTVQEELSRPGVHLITLTGPGGVGKTRLGLEVAAGLLDQFEDGVFFIPLAPIRDPSLVSSTIAWTLGLHESKGKPLMEALKELVRDKQLLLVLDNFEHVTEAAPLVTELLAAAPGVKVLVTSRTLLHVYGEHLHPVLPMALPCPGKGAQFESMAQSAAVQLFVERARAVKAGFSLTDENIQAVSKICLCLDGLPLAIELAAARMRLISPQVMLSQWAGDGGRSPLQTLTGGPRDLPSRHKTLRNAIAWSYNLLDLSEQAVFRRAGVFVGGWTLEATEKVIRDLRPADSCPTAISDSGLLIAGVLETLADNHLLEQSELDGERRFSMLETIREYALEQLVACEEMDASRRVHAEYYLALAETARLNLLGPHQTAWVNRLAQEYDNLRAALIWGIDNQNAELALQLVAALGKFWYIYDPIYWSEGRRWLERALNLPTPEPVPLDVRAKALNEAGVLAWAQDDHPQAIRYFEECLALRRKVEDKAGIGSALGNLGLVARERLDLPRARAYQEESLAIKRELDDKQGMATSLSNLALVVADQGDCAYAIALYEESLVLNRELQNKSGLTLTLHNLGGMLVENQGDFTLAKALLDESLALSRQLGRSFFLIPYTLDHQGNLALHLGDCTRARSFFEESLSLAREADNKFGTGHVLHSFGRLSQLEGDDEKAQEFYNQSVAVLQEVNGLVGIIWNFISLAGLACRRGQPLRAATLLGASERLRHDSSASLLLTRADEYQHNIAVARAQLSEEDFNRVWAEGQAMSLVQALTYATGDSLPQI